MSEHRKYLATELDRLAHEVARGDDFDEDALHAFVSNNLYLLRDAMNEPGDVEAVKAEVAEAVDAAGCEWTTVLGTLKSHREAAEIGTQRIWRESILANADHMRQQLQAVADMDAELTRLRAEVSRLAGENAELRAALQQEGGANDA